MKKTKWLIYTVLIGLLPLFIRLIIYIISVNKEITYVLNEVDIVTFGLVLQLTNINELDDNEYFDKNTKMLYVGLSIFFLVIFSAFLGATYLSEDAKEIVVNKNKIKILSTCMGIGSFCMSFSIYHRLSTLSNENI